MGVRIRKDYYDDGKIKGIYYLKDELLHRFNNKPAAIIYFKNGKVRRKDYCIENKYYREKGPVSLRYYNNGQVREKIYSKNSSTIFNRNIGPAYQLFYKNGIKKRIMFIIDGSYHNENGPAIITYDVNGKIDTEDYYLSGVLYETKEKWQLKLRNKKIKKINEK